MQQQLLIQNAQSEEILIESRVSLVYVVIVTMCP